MYKKLPFTPRVHYNIKPTIDNCFLDYIFTYFDDRKFSKVAKLMELTELDIHDYRFCRCEETCTKEVSLYEKIMNGIPIEDFKELIKYNIINPRDDFLLYDLMYRSKLTDEIQEMIKYFRKIMLQLEYSS